MKHKDFLVAVLLSLSYSCMSQTASETPAYRDMTLAPEVRAADLVSRMTVEEKVTQVVQTSAAIPRLGIPEYDWWSEGLHGVAGTGYATVFPQAIGLAATFDEPLLKDVAEVIGTEARALHHETMRRTGKSGWFHGLTIWSPNINIFRDPRWGRGQETYGEDPYLTSRLGVAFVQGLQGNDTKYLRAISTPKHFAVHSGPEPLRHRFDVNVTPHDLEDTYLPAFRATVIEGGAGSVMCAYNSVRGEPACANSMLLQDYLRKSWGFKGYVVSDCDAIANIWRDHHFVKDMPAAETIALRSGTDLFCGDEDSKNKVEVESLLTAVRSGELPIAELDSHLVRLFTARVRLGMMDPQPIVPYGNTPYSELDSEPHGRLALRAARESIVLLKNDGILPLKKRYKTIAVIGPNADSVAALQGNYNGDPSHPVTILRGIRNRFSDANILYTQGTGHLGKTLGVIPSRYLRPAQGATEQGLAAQYFPNMALAGVPAIKRVDQEINFKWAPQVGVNENLRTGFSVRWEGTVTPPSSGEYEIGFTGDDGYRFWFDGKLVAEDWSDHAASTKALKVRLEEGHSYPVKIDFYQHEGGSEARLVWAPPVSDDEALDTARRADLVFMVLGLTAQLEGEEMSINADGFKGGDRTRLDLPVPQQAMLERVHALGKPIVLILLNGSALAVNWADEHANAIVEAWYPGEEGGTAVAEALAGDFSPAGRLPITFYRSHEQLPAFEDYSLVGRTYRYFTKEPLYPFGFGLSYSNFEYSKLRIEPDTTSVDGAVKIAVNVRNTGKFKADEVVQVYLSRPDISGAPLRALQAFRRIQLGPGEAQNVDFTLSDRQLSTVDDLGVRKIVPGKVSVFVGGGQPVTRPGLGKTAGVAGSFSITTEKTLPK